MLSIEGAAVYAKSIGSIMVASPNAVYVLYPQCLMVILMKQLFSGA